MLHRLLCWTHKYSYQLRDIIITSYDKREETIDGCWMLQWLKIWNIVDCGRVWCVCVWVVVCLCVHAYACMRLCLCVCVCAWVCMCMCVYMFMYMCMCGVCVVAGDGRGGISFFYWRGLNGEWYVVERYPMWVVGIVLHIIVYYDITYLNSQLKGLILICWHFFTA